MRALVLLVVLPVSAVCQGLGFTVDDCPRHVPRDQNVRIHGNRCFYFQLSSRHEFTTAEQACRAIGGTLATVADRETQEFVYRVLQDDYHTDLQYWIGLRNTDGTFLWTDGEEANYVNWAPRTLVVAGENNGCAAIDPSQGGQWRLFPCDYTAFFDVVLPFICQFPISSECQRCGDVDNDVACTQLELTFAPFHRCDEETPYCMNDVIQSSGVRRIFKRCASQSECQVLWWQGTSGNADCMALDDNSTITNRDNSQDSGEDLRCHFCCDGNDCNNPLVPETSTLYRPPGVTVAPPSTTTTTATSTVTDSTTSTTTTTVTHSTIDDATSPTTDMTTAKAPLPGSVCAVCEDVENGVPCLSREVIIPTFVTCDDSTPYCMTDIVQRNNNGVVTVDRFKRCVNETECYTLWFEGTGDINLCVNFRADQSSDDLDCHLCCYGDRCNAMDTPPPETLYRP